MGLIKKFLLGLLAILLISCSSGGDDYKKKLNVDVSDVETPALTLRRYDKVLFSLDTNDFQNALKSIQHDYMPFIGGNLDDSAAVNYLRLFVVDSFTRAVAEKVTIQYPDDDAIKKDIVDVFRHISYYYPTLDLPNLVYTYVSGIDYQTPPIMINGDAVLIALDYYLSCDEVYDQIGMPRYRSVRTFKQTLLRDLSVAVYQNKLEKPYRQTDLLHEMIRCGKRLYFAEVMTPMLHDTILMGYPTSQMNWVLENEGAVWSSLVGEQLLYNTSLNTLQQFLGDGPFTQAFSQEAPARLGELVGLQIVRSYMTHNNVSLPTMLENNDLQGILQDSYYKPRK